MDDYLEDDEELLLEARPHGAALVGPLARSLVLAGAGGAILVLGSEEHWLLAVLGGAALLLAALAALLAVWRWDSTRIVVTDDQLLVVTGIVGHRAAAVSLGGAHVEVEQGLAGRLLGYGTLHAGELEVPYVADPVYACRLAR